MCSHSLEPSFLHEFGCSESPLFCLAQRQSLEQKSSSAVNWEKRAVVPSIS